MKVYCLLLVMLSGLLLSSCAGDFWTRSSSDQSQKPVVSSPAGADTILSCLAEPEHQELSRKDFRTVYKTVSAQAAGGTDSDTLRLICLSFHDYASLKQLKSGRDTLANYIKTHPDDAASLQGLYALMQRIEKEVMIKWNQSNKKLDEKEGLEAENKELLERNEILGKGAAQDKERIRGLQEQIEQLKNIDKIIKNRER
jgi:hypothetical protein